MRALLFLPGLLAATAKPPQSSRTYLGSVKNSRGIPVYHVVRQFRLIPAALTARGRSEVVIYDAHWHPLAFYDVGVPAALPVKLRGNTLYFRQAATICQQLIDPAASPPAWLCAAPGDCFHKLNP